MQSDFMRLACELNFDISMQEDTMWIAGAVGSSASIWIRPCIKTEVIDELADRAGVGEEVRRITNPPCVERLISKRVSLGA